MKPIASPGETTSDSALVVASLIDEGSSKGSSVDEHVRRVGTGRGKR